MMQVTLLSSCFVLLATLLDGLSGIRVPKLEPLASRLLTQSRQDEFPFSITGKLLKKWTERRGLPEVAAQRARNPDLGVLLDDLARLNQMDSLDCTRTEQIFARLQLERHFHSGYVNLHAFIYKMNQLHINTCLYNFDWRLREDLNKLGSKTIELLDGIANLARVPARRGRSASGLLLIMDAHQDQLTGRSELVDPLVNEVARSHYLDAAIHMARASDRIFSHEWVSLAEHESYFERQYKSLLLDACDQIYPNLMNFGNLLVGLSNLNLIIDIELDSPYLTYLDLESYLDFNEEQEWAKYYRVCKFLMAAAALPDKPVYRMFMDHVNVRRHEETLSYQQTLNRVLMSPNEQEVRRPELEVLMNQSNLAPESLRLDPYKTAEYLTRLVAEYPAFDHVIFPLGALRRILESSQVTPEKCTKSSLQERRLQAQTVAATGSFPNINHYLVYFADRQAQICSLMFNSMVSNYINRAGDQNLLQLEQLRTFAVALMRHLQRRGGSGRVQLPRIDSIAFDSGVAKFFHVNKRPLAPMASTFLLFHGLMVETCSAFYERPEEETFFYWIQMLEMMDINALRRPIVDHFLSYESICQRFIFHQFIYRHVMAGWRHAPDVLAHLRMPTSFKEVWHQTSSERSRLASLLGCVVQR